MTIYLNDKPVEVADSITEREVKRMRSGYLFCAAIGQGKVLGNVDCPQEYFSGSPHHFQSGVKSEDMFEPDVVEIGIGSSDARADFEPCLRDVDI